MDSRVIIIGAGPAGLAAAYYLLKHSDIKPVIIEESDFVGGLSGTRFYNGNCMDLGGHRFFTRNKEIMNFWKEIFPVINSPLKEGINSEKVFLTRKRFSRIYFLNKFFDYPISLKPQTFINMGLFNVITSGFGYLSSCFKKKNENSLEDFYINTFGRPFYKMFFEDYTQKVWGVHPSDISPVLGRQRVKGLSVLSELSKFIKNHNETEPFSNDKFLYPPYGPGQFYEELAAKIEKMGGTIIRNMKVTQIHISNENICSVSALDKNGNKVDYETDVVFSSMSVKDLISSIDKGVPNEVKNTAANLPYRDYMIAGLLLNKLLVGKLKDCWIYIQERKVKLGRIQIFNNWSPYMVKDSDNKIFVGLEYFCEEGDSMWSMQDSDFIKMAASELEKIHIINADDILDSTVIRIKKAYPAYFGAYNNFETVKKYLLSINNLYCIGRNGRHRYNNMDHSILSGFDAARVLLDSLDKEIIWKNNEESEYLEIN